MKEYLNDPELINFLISRKITEGYISSNIDNIPEDNDHCYFYPEGISLHTNYHFVCKRRINNVTYPVFWEIDKDTSALKGAFLVSFGCFVVGIHKHSYGNKVYIHVIIPSNNGNSEDNSEIVWMTASDNIHKILMLSEVNKKELILLRHEFENFKSEVLSLLKSNLSLSNQKEGSSFR